MHNSNKASRRILCALVVLMTLTIESGAQSRDRAQIPDKYKWNLADIYPTDAAWRAAKDKLAADLPKLRQYQGKLASSAATLADALDCRPRFDKELSPALRLRQHARRSGHARRRRTKAMRQEMVQLAADVRRRSRRSSSRRS